MIGINVKQILFISMLLFMCLSTPLPAQNVDELMAQGNSFFQNGDYRNAVDSYEQILDMGYTSTALYYNLGNAYFKLNELGRAILFYEKAMKISPNDEDVLYNLRIANARTVDKIQDVPQIFIVEWWEVLITAFSVSGWSVIVIVFYILFLILAGIFILTKNAAVQRFSFMLGSVNLGIFVLTLILLLSSINRETSTDYGILISTEAVAKVSPDKDSGDAFVIHEGVKFEVQDELKGWSKIELSDGKVGWLPSGSFEVI